MRRKKKWSKQYFDETIYHRKRHKYKKKHLKGGDYNMAFTQEQFDELVKSVNNVSELLEGLKEQHPGAEDSFTQADLDRVVEALQALVSKTEE